jgi:hypothetical protein
MRLKYKWVILVFADWLYIVLYAAQKVLSGIEWFYIMWKDEPCAEWLLLVLCKNRDILWLNALLPDFRHDLKTYI